MKGGRRERGGERDGEGWQSGGDATAEAPAQRCGQRDGRRGQDPPATACASRGGTGGGGDRASRCHAGARAGGTLAEGRRQAVPRRVAQSPAPGRHRHQPLSKGEGGCVTRGDDGADGGRAHRRASFGSLFLFFSFFAVRRLAASSGTEGSSRMRIWKYMRRSPGGQVAVKRFVLLFNCDLVCPVLVFSRGGWS